MATALRAFLMTRSGAEWSVSVHRELEDLLEAWKARANPDETIGVLHLGFDRPPSREFDSVAEPYAGHMLVTAAAKFGLPSGFVTSEGEVGTVGGLPVYLGIRGWGYSVDQALIPQRKPVRPDFDDQTPTGWVSQFLEEHPEARPEFEACGVFNEASYRESEGGLSNSLRGAAGAFRFDRILAGDPHDPCAFARAAPPWLLEQDFDTMSVSVRVANVFTNLDIRTVSDLSTRSLADLLETQNFGRKSAADLLGSLRAAMQNGPIGRPSLEKDAVQSTLIESIKASLFKYPDRAREIMLRRMGLGQRPETLQDLGERFGVTRERIRQIEAKVIKRLIKEEIWDDILTHKLAALMEDRRIPLPLKGIEAIDSWFEGVGDEDGVLAYLLANVSQGPAKILRINSTDYIGVLVQEEWDEAASGGRRMLENGVEGAWSFDHCRSIVQALLPERCKEFRELLWDQASQQAQFVERDGQTVLVAYGRGAEHLVHAVLAAADQPLHYAEIAELAKIRSGRDIEIRRAHNAAANVGLLFGRGTYGLDQHLPISPEAMTLIADEAEQIVAEGALGRQWHTAEIATEIIERGSQLAPGLDKYLLDIALKRSGNLESLGRLVWSAGDSEGAAFRIDLRQAIIASLQDAGTPLRTEEIRQRVLSMRGVDKLFQIAPVDPVMRIAPGLWGLNDRDLAIKRPDQPRMLDALVELLSKRGAGLHFSELEQSPTLNSWGLTVTGFFSLATTDPRLRVSTGRYLFLDEWGGPRRESLAEAVDIVMRESASAMSITEIISRVEVRIGRSCDRPAVSACLQALDAVYDAEAGTWTWQLEETAGSELEMAAE